MQGISGIILMIIIACLLPYVFTLIAKAKGGFQAKDNHNPREFLEKLREGSFAKRMAAAQANSWEALGMFAPAVLLATIRGVDAGMLNLLAGVFIAARLVYLWCYAKDLATARSSVWSVGVIAVVGLYIAAAQV